MHDRRCGQGVNTSAPGISGIREKRRGERMKIEIKHPAGNSCRGMRTEEEVKREALARLKETLLALDRWKRESLSSSVRY